MSKSTPFVWSPKVVVSLGLSNFYGVLKRDYLWSSLKVYVLSYVIFQLVIEVLLWNI